MNEKIEQASAGVASVLNAELGLLTNEETHLLRQWFNAVQDLNPAYLEAQDYVLAEKIIKSLGLRVPISISEKVKKCDICPNCDTALPKGCGGIFKNDGQHCWMNKT